ncbi:hypothetical protein UFOVP1183_8 [uncultured Caudovirales phage]|uniref:Uncharacterized protein n=1 Tax=uncultured Caudovirales phage TaxID=2100421 RepID=A0A6J5PTT0_9CAUD|nr:hypothetical protein UFOVP955_25 [uncultured Caudovirales phage]CAB4185182.1 hypothetical protein UFOVP1120_14 [uncultured Caudovirales phage]CAB4188196.1 hypothetical protein UFOVP1183_8 [uncultured Caudovirales phage]CAB4191456.1 hypothetical protein UFOVP1227_40 [uncultured Caudovirales phage]CAB5229690.1 hypothetical protein UFOVP1571_14 [uncultured Caudovirales phage]
MVRFLVADVDIARVQRELGITYVIFPPVMMRSALRRLLLREFNLEETAEMVPYRSAPGTGSAVYCGCETLAEMRACGEWPLCPLHECA